MFCYGNCHELHTFTILEGMLGCSGCGFYSSWRDYNNARRIYEQDRQAKAQVARKENLSVTPIIKVVNYQSVVNDIPRIKEGNQEFIREVVMIPCRYCGALLPQTNTSCPNCGARRTV
jgi:hypothetical protein